MDYNPSSWVSATHMEEQDGVFGFQLQPGSALAFVAIWEVKWWMEDAVFSLAPHISDLIIFKFYLFI